MEQSESVNVLIDRPGGRTRPGRVFLDEGVFLTAPTRHGPLARTLGAWSNGLFGYLPESLGLYDPFAVSRAEAIENPETIRVRYGDVEALAPVVRPTGFSLHLRVARRGEIELGFRSNEERRELVDLARAIHDRATEAGSDVELFEPTGRTRLVSLSEG